MEHHLSTTIWREFQQTKNVTHQDIESVASICYINLNTISESTVSYLTHVLVLFCHAYYYSNRNKNGENGTITEINILNEKIGLDRLVINNKKCD